MAVPRTPIDFGSKLREARERRGVSLREIANATKISVAVLEALERNDISRLPGGIFSRAIVRSYAVQVGLDPESATHDFIGAFPQDSVTVGHPTHHQGGDNEETESRRRTARTVLGLTIIGLPIAAVLLYFGTANRRATRGTDSPPAVSAPAAPSSLNAPVAASTDPGPPTQAPERSAPATTDRAAASSPPAQTASESNTTPAPAVDRLMIGLTVRRPCWVSATVDGKKTIEQLLPAGDQRTIEVRREMVLTAGDAAAIAVTLNGAEARALGRAGEVVTTRLSLTNFKDYLQHR